MTAPASVCARQGVLTELEKVSTLENSGGLPTFASNQNHKAMKEEIIYVVDSLGVSHPETIERADWSLARLFVEGGPAGMIVISLLLIALLVAAWKAPRWVKEIGIGALVVSVFWSIYGFYQICDVLPIYGDYSGEIICGGLKVSLIPVLYGLIIYFISLIIRVIQKPRI